MKRLFHKDLAKRVVRLLVKADRCLLGAKLYETEAKRYSLWGDGYNPQLLCASLQWRQHYLRKYDRMMRRYEKTMIKIEDGEMYG